MFCDLVNSTAIAQELGVESWRDFLEGYHSACADVVSRHGGDVHEYMGDGLLVYFGYPTVYEDSARRAVRAGIDIAHNSDRLFAVQRELLRRKDIGAPRVRVGIHSGPVVIGEMSGRVTATGSTVACAERLQEVAQPNQVIISHETLQLVKADFQVESLGNRTLKGFDQDRECFVVRQEANVARNLTPFIGRSDEMTLLRQEWRAIRPRNPRVVLLYGGAGIGKSRLVREFQATLDSAEAQIFEWRCSPYFQNNALYPIIQEFRQILGFGRHPEPEDKLGAIEALIPDTLDRAVLVPAIASLLSVPYESRYPKLTGTAEQQRSLIEDAIVNWLAHEALRRPVLIVVEDVNWSDPSTLELIGRLSERVDSGPILLILAYRTDNSDAWTCPFAARPIRIGRLSAESAQEMIAKSRGAHALPVETVRLLVERTDGVPLFIEESAAMAVISLASGAGQENRALQDERGVYRIPTTIQDLLTQRLSSVGSAKATAQIAAAIGREFSFDLLRAVTDKDEAELHADLKSLTDSGLILTESSRGEHQYAFKHALVGDAAYASLVTSDRRTIHDRIARALEHEGRGAQAAEPELLAHHFTEAGNLPRAIEYWLEAGVRAKRRSAQAEAINHFERALEGLGALPEDADLDVLEVELSAQRSLAACHTAIGGYSAVEARDAYRRAEELAQTLGDDESLLKARFGLAGYYMMCGRFDRAYDIAETCEQMVEAPRTGEPASDPENVDRITARAQASWVIGNVLFHQAEFGRAMPYLERCVELCKPTSPGQRHMTQDPVVMCLAYQSLSQWLSGFPDQALSTVEAGVSIARQGGHPFSIGVALSFQACVHFFRREYQAAVDKATESISVSEEPGFKTWLAWAKVLRGRALSEWDEHRAGGITEILEGLRLWDDSGAIVTRPFSLVLLAESFHLDGQDDKALDRIRKAQEMVDQYGERFYEAEIKRVHGNLILNGGPTDSETNIRLAADAYLASLDFARERDMKSSVLRTTIDLSRLRWALGRRSAAIAELEAALAPLTEGLETGDLRTAQELLAKMRGAESGIDTGRQAQL